MANKNIPSNNPEYKKMKRVKVALDKIIQKGGYQGLFDQPNGLIHHDVKFQNLAMAAVLEAREIGMSVPRQLEEDLGLPHQPGGWSNIPEPEPEVYENPTVPDEDDDSSAPF